MLTRRDLLRLTSCAALGVAFGDLMRADDPAPAPGDPRAITVTRPATRCVWIQLAGGVSHLDTFDPKPGREVMGSTRTIATNVDGIQLGAALPRLAKQMDQLAIVRAVTSTQGAHEQGEYFMRTGFQLRGTVRHPTLGSWAARTLDRLDPALPSYVAVNPGSQHPGAGFLDARFNPLPVGNPDQGLAHAKLPGKIDQARFDRRMGLVHDLDPAKPRSPGDQAYRDLTGEAVALMRSPDLDAFDLRKEPPESAAAYGESAFGKGLLLARRLMEHRVRFTEVTFGGWDTHDDNFDRVENQCEILDEGLSALLTDLRERNLWDDTLVVVATEFGRTPKINVNEGRDHHPKCFSCLLAGGPIRTGQAHGASDADGMEPDDGAATIPDFQATVAAALGLPLRTTFTSPDGRPFHIADKGKPIRALLA